MMIYQIIVVLLQSVSPIIHNVIIFLMKCWYLSQIGRNRFLFRFSQSSNGCFEVVFSRSNQGCGRNVFAKGENGFSSRKNGL